MKKIFLLSMLLITPFIFVIAQEQKELARFYVTHATINGNDITEWAVSNKAFTVFYSISEDLYMANYMEEADTQSWGVIWGLKSETIPETSTDYKRDVFYFNWNYQNSYDSKKGTCKVQFIKIYKPQGIVSVLRLITESLDITEYTGYMNGTVEFDSF